MPRIRIQVIEHKTTGLLAAHSDDLRGFHVFGQTEEELFNKLAGAFSEFMEAIGQPVSDVKIYNDTPKGFSPPRYVLNSVPQPVHA